MYKHILISTDGSELAQKGVEHGLALAKTNASKITVVTVTEPYPLQSAATIDSWATAQKHQADEALATVETAALKHAVQQALTGESAEFLVFQFRDMRLRNSQKFGGGGGGLRQPFGFQQVIQAHSQLNAQLTLVGFRQSKIGKYVTAAEFNCFCSLNLGFGWGAHGVPCNVVGRA